MEGSLEPDGKSKTKRSKKSKESEAAPKAEAKTKKAKLSYNGTPRRPSTESQGSIQDFRPQDITPQKSPLSQSQRSSLSPLSLVAMVKRNGSKNETSKPVDSHGRDNGHERSAQVPKQSEVPVQAAAHVVQPIRAAAGNGFAAAKAIAAYRDVDSPAGDWKDYKDNKDDKNDEEIEDAKAIAASRDVDGLAGDWKEDGEKIGTILDSMMRWFNGAAETHLSRHGNNIYMELDGEQHSGIVGQAQTEIHWNDGSVWRKETAEIPESTGQQCERDSTQQPVTVLNPGRAQSACLSNVEADNGHAVAVAMAGSQDFEMLAGDWKLEGEKIGTITDSILIWSDGSPETKLFKQGDDICMELDGEQYTGNVGIATGEIHWNDGDIWHKVMPANPESTDDWLDGFSSPGKPNEFPAEFSLDEKKEAPACRKAILSSKISIQAAPDSSPVDPKMVFHVDSNKKEHASSLSVPKYDRNTTASLSTLPESLGVHSSREDPYDSDSENPKPLRQVTALAVKAAHPQESVVPSTSTAITELNGVAPPAKVLATAEPAAPLPRSLLKGIEGQWYVTDGGDFLGTISTGAMIWDGGMSSTLCFEGEDLVMEGAGERCIGRLLDSGRQILWSDGDLWQKSKPTPESEASIFNTKSHGELLVELLTCKNLAEDLQKKQIQWQVEKAHLEMLNHQLHVQLAAQNTY
eukprot:gnl/MRDRNA2_/MRDRNA2_30402_c0_seq1.p1 gnl/MRDRNA2_/MRDRNA2_30402_c0~~gnl/MRDRNA2_/MRDRNA2_30402_c0_seq1.p1  ORF type:complete len:690 (+),score=144.09 gnl/MRDRNA2_/MRDRNA2_30402_c0_seq1:131-2200(+)